MKDMVCDFCGSKLIKVVSSNISCTNKNCKNYINNEQDFLFLDYYTYNEISDFDMGIISDNIKTDYDEDYDKFLFYSDREDYISRFEYREMNNFLEDQIFKKNQINVEKHYLEDDEIEFKEYLTKKYEIINAGRDLESQDSQKALEFYKSKLHNRLFKNDYYIYKKIVKLEKDYHNQLEVIIVFFNSGIYCNRYHYLWFLKKLHNLSEKIPISDEIIDSCLKAFKTNGFRNKKHEDEPIFIAEKITLNNNVLKVRTDCEYTLRQFKFELKEESSNLNQVKQYKYSAEIIEKLIFNHGFKAATFFETICNNYHKIGDYENELKWIYGYFNKTRRFNNPNDYIFNNKLRKLNIKTNTFSHNSLFFDTNEYYLTEEDFNENQLNQFELTEYISLIKDKYSMILKGLELEQNSVIDAIEYYKSILNHELFKNDYYLYKTLVILYDQEGYFEEELNTIINFLTSGIYCNRFNYLFFLFHLKKLGQEFIIEDYEIDEWLKSFKENSFINKHKENTPVPLTERLTFDNNRFSIIPAEKFETDQEIQALDLESRLYESNSMFNSANETYKIMIRDYDIISPEVYKQICVNYQELNDVECEKYIITQFLENNGGWNYYEEKFFKDRMYEIENSSNQMKKILEPNFEIIFENNDYYLNYEDFKSNVTDEYNELIDNLRYKLRLRIKGWDYENEDYQKAIDYYNDLLNDNLFKDDYYPYRKLVIYYEKLNDFERVWKTIKSFFNSGIYCNRYQYIWFLHKIEAVSRFMFISDEEINECLRNFKYNGFKNRNLENSIIIAERLYKVRSSLKLLSAKKYDKTQKEYELKEELYQLELNGYDEESIDILRGLIDKDSSSYKDYMRLCHAYRKKLDYENELCIINKYLSSDRKYSRGWFEDRLKQVEKLMENECNDN